MSAFRKLVLTFGAAAISMVPAFGQLPGIDGVAAGPAGEPTANVGSNNVICDVRQEPLTVRVEGLAELLGDVVIDCRGFLRINPRNALASTAAAAVVPTINISLTLSVPLTSRLVADPLVEALLFVDDPKTAGAIGAAPVGAAANRDYQNPCTGSGAVCDMVTSDAVAGGSATLASGSGGAILNIFQGRRQNNQTVTFAGVPFNFFDRQGNPDILAALVAARALPGGYTGAPLQVPVNRRYRIKNVRGAIAGAASVNTQVFGFISIQNPTGNLQLNAASVTVGFVQTGLAFSLRDVANGGGSGGISFASCTTVNRDLAVDAADTDPYNLTGLIARFQEGYQIAFKVRGFVPGQLTAADQNQPDVNYETESGWYSQFMPTTNGLAASGVATHGTRLRLVVNNVPANIRIYTSVAGVLGTSSTMGIYAVVADASGLNISPVTVPIFPTATGGAPGALPGSVPLTTITGAAIPASSFVTAGSTNGLALVTLTSGRGTQTYEVYAARKETIEVAHAYVTVAYRAASNPGLGTATIQGTFAPINTTASASGSAPIPRFVETGSAGNAFTFSPCLTNLLFPFVTNQAGFNTGIAISNTSLTNPGTGELFGLDANAGVAPQSGTCTLNYFGTTGADGAAPPPATTGVIPAGRTFVMTLASGSSGPFGTVPPALNFQGYMIAQCNFRYAHGYAFISDIGAVQLAQGYIALVMDAAIGTRTGNASEVLGH